MANWVPEKEFGELTEQKKKLKDRFGVRKESTKIDIWMRNKLNSCVFGNKIL